MRTNWRNTETKDLFLSMPPVCFFPHLAQHSTHFQRTLYLVFCTLCVCHSILRITHIYTKLKYSSTVRVLTSMPRMSSSQIVAKKSRTHRTHSAVHFVKSRYISFFILHWVMSLVVLVPFFALSHARSLFSAVAFDFFQVCFSVLTCIHIKNNHRALANNNISCFILL